MQTNVYASLNPKMALPRRYRSFLVTIFWRTAQKVFASKTHVTRATLLRLGLRLRCLESWRLYHNKPKSYLLDLEAQQLRHENIHNFGTACAIYFILARGLSHTVRHGLDTNRETPIEGPETLQYNHFPITVTTSRNSSMTGFDWPKPVTKNFGRHCKHSCFHCE